MKNPFLRGALIATSWFALTALSSAQITGVPEFDPLGEFNNLPKQIRVQVEFIDVSHEQFTELMFGDKPAANDTELRKQLTQLVKDGKANIAETMLCIARSGQKATSESIEEFIYPTEYEPATGPTETPAADKEAKDKPSTEPAKEPAPDPAIGPTPTAFETRNVGSTLEIEPTLSEDNRIVDLRFVPEIVYHVGNVTWAEWKGEHGNTPVQMPTFYTVRLNTSVTLAAGEPMMVGALSPKNQAGQTDSTRKMMVFVRADVLTTGR